MSTIIFCVKFFLLSMLILSTGLAGFFSLFIILVTVIKILFYVSELIEEIKWRF